MQKSLIILFSLFSLSSCFHEGKTLGPFRFDKGCTDKVIPCGNWIYTYFLYKSWLRSYPKLEELKQGQFIDENKNLIRDDIDFFIDHILVENYDLWPDMYSVIRQYARVHGKYHDVKFTKSSGKYFLNNEHNFAQVCKDTFYLRYEKLLKIESIFKQIDYLTLTQPSGKIDQNFLLFRYYPYKKSPDKFIPSRNGDLSTIFNIPIYCDFKSVNKNDLFDLYKKGKKDWIIKRNLKREIEKFKKTHGAEHRQFYEEFLRGVEN